MRTPDSSDRSFVRYIRWVVAPALTAIDVPTVASIWPVHISVAEVPVMIQPSHGNRVRNLGKDNIIDGVDWARSTGACTTETNKQFSENRPNNSRTTQSRSGPPSKAAAGPTTPVANNPPTNNSFGTLRRSGPDVWTATKYRATVADIPKPNRRTPASKKNSEIDPVIMNTIVHAADKGRRHRCAKRC